MVVIYAALLIWCAIAKSTSQANRLVIAVTVLNGLMDTIISCLICNIVYESNKVRLTNDQQGNVRFRRADQDSESSEEEQVVEFDEELEEWLSDD
jgi:hypothetical protein